MASRADMRHRTESSGRGKTGATVQRTAFAYRPGVLAGLDSGGKPQGGGFRLARTGPPAKIHMSPPQPG